jgi:hypothetical protein
MLAYWACLIVVATPPGTVVSFIPAQARAYCGSPAIAMLPTGEYVISHDEFGPGSTRDTTHVYLSDNQGKRWKHCSTITGQWWSSLFVHQDALYLLGTTREYGSIVIRKSTSG